MRPLLILILLLFSSFCFAQNTGFIVGKVLDKDFNNEPLSFANISVKETDVISNSDHTGLFLIEHLEEGNYTLVCNFPGYETKELEVQVITGQPIEVTVSLAPITISLSDLAVLDSSNIESTTGLNN